MEQSACEYSGCVELAQSVCRCQEVLICASHRQDHLRSSGTHRVFEVNRKTSNQEEYQLQKAYGTIRQSVQTSLCQTLHLMGGLVNKLADQGYRTHSQAFRTLKATLGAMDLWKTNLSSLYLALAKVDCSVQALQKLDWTHRSWATRQGSRERIHWRPRGLRLHPIGTDYLHRNR